NVVFEDRDNLSGDLKYTKTYEYVLVPKETGSDFIYPQLTYFDVDSAKYITIKDTFRVNIKQGSNAPVSGLVKKEKEEEKVIRPIIRQSSLGSISPSFFGSIPFWILSCIPLFLIGGIFYKKRKQVAEDGISVSDRKQALALKVAEGHLKEAKKYLDLKESKAFYKAIDSAILGFVSDKFKIPTSDLSKEKVLQILAEHQKSDEMQDSFKSIMQTCEQALYGFGGDIQDMQSMYDQAKQWIFSNFEF
ncbi:MAG: hypothetical protein AAGK97_10600, partial [Bacteroidota bacterium]